METYRRQTLQGKTLNMDESVFIECKLIDCDLFYAGGDFEWVNTGFENCRFHWRGPAKNMLALLQSTGILRLPEGTPVLPNLPKTGQKLN